MRKDFASMAKLTMIDSNSFHACCMDTYPPLFYLNDKSREIIRLVNEFNSFETSSNPQIKAAYSFDAGPNAFIFVQDEHLNDLVFLIYKAYFGSFLSELEFMETKCVQDKSKVSAIDFANARKDLLSTRFSTFLSKNNGAQSDDESILKYLLHSKVGVAPAIFHDSWERSLLNQDGEPI